MTALSCIERGIGFIYRIYLSRALGSEGLGLYQIALSVIGVLITLSASGIPITVSRLMIKEKTSKNKDGVNATVSAGIAASLAVCIPLCLIFFIFHNALDLIFADDRCKLLFLIMLPGVTLTSVYAVIRGYFWGTKNFYTYAVIELLEEAVMFIFGTIAVYKAITVSQKTISASLAVLISYIFSFTVSVTVFFIRGGRLKNPLRQIKPLVLSSAPITFMRGATSLTNSLTALILPAALIAGGMSKQQAVSEFGIISGMTMPLLFIPSTIIGSISLVLVPELSDNFYRKQTEKIQTNTEKALLSSATIACLIIPLFIGTGNYIGTLVYNNELSGTYLRFAAPVMLPMAVTMISTSLLNSMGMERKTLVYYLSGALCLVGCIMFLPRVIGNYALIGGHFINFTVNATLNVLLLKKICCNKLLFIKKLIPMVAITAFCSLLCVTLSQLLNKFIPPFFAFSFACGITFVCEIVCIKTFSLDK